MPPPVPFLYVRYLNPADNSAKYAGDPWAHYPFLNPESHTSHGPTPLSAPQPRPSKLLNDTSLPTQNGTQAETPIAAKAGGLTLMLENHYATDRSTD